MTTYTVVDEVEFTSDAAIYCPGDLKPPGVYALCPVIREVIGDWAEITLQSDGQMKGSAFITRASVAPDYPGAENRRARAYVTYLTGVHVLFKGPVLIRTTGANVVDLLREVP